MSDHAQLARTGVGGVLVIGGTAITGSWLLAIAATIIFIGAVMIRVGFRRGRTAGQR